MHACSRYKNKDGYDESSCKIGHYSPEKTVVTTESFIERSCKKTVGAIRDSDAVSYRFVTHYFFIFIIIQIE